MKITFRPFDFESDEEWELLARWQNDEEIRHFSCVFKSEDDYSKIKTGKQLKDHFKNKKNPAGRSYVILLDGIPVGECSIAFRQSQMIHQDPQTAWPGIIIGEASARGKGIGKTVMKFLEQESKKQGATRIELGVFEFNERAIRLYQKLGYQEIKRIPGITYWNGKLWGDIRMVKKLSV